tara:strand:+ start:601 stop:939 length:339 start_codon:yes stop_codon:yes gene_type:complete
MYKPRQLSYTNTVSTMGRMGERKNIINDYCEIRDKYEKNIISRMLKENNSDKDKEIFSFIKNEKLDEFIECFNPNNINIRRRKEFLEQDSMVHDVVTVFSKDENDLNLNIHD